MEYSQNGWPASPDKSAIGIVSVKVPTTNVDILGGIKDGAVRTVLMYVAAQFNATVEPVRQGVCGGYIYRKIVGGTSLSNHASGTAMDLNWDKHPLGVANTFSATQRSRLRTILQFCEGYVRWGGDYSTRKDEMHFEIWASAANISRIAQKITDSHQPALPFLKVDGDLGPRTIERWQQVMGTHMDGVISDPSDLVKAIQRRLRATVDRDLIVDGYGIYQDGKYYKTSEDLQRYVKVPVDGRISSPVSETIKAVQRRLNEGRF